MTRNRPTFIPLLFLACAACGPNNTQNNDADDMAAVADMGMMLDMPEEVDANMPDLDEPVDMFTPESPEDCGEQEWFSTNGPSCQTCPASTLACNSLDSTRTEISAQDNFFTVAFDEEVIEVKSVVLHYTSYYEAPDTENVSPGIVPIPNEADVKKLGRQYVVSPMLEAMGSTGDFDLEYLLVTDKCGTEHRLDLEGSWNAKTGELTAAFGCSEPE